MKTRAANEPRRRPRRLVLVAWLLVITLSLSAGVWFLWREFQAFSNTPLAVAPDSVIVLTPGSGLNEMLDQLDSIGVLTAPRWRWRLLVRQLALERKLQAGEFAVKPGLDPRELLFAIASGKVVQHRLTIIEGTRFRDLRAQIEGIGALQQTLKGLDELELLRRIGASEAHPEGLFLPETYQFPRGFTDLELLKKAYWAQKAVLEDAWGKRRPDSPLATPYQALILASIIEKETGYAPERPEISGVFTRRMKLGMRLQTDPTVIYGLGDAFDGNLRRRDLVADTPYNTYTRYGLPPTPIALPGSAAIRAALSPRPGESLYFVSRKDGTHEFSSNYADHRAAVRKFQLSR